MYFSPLQQKITNPFRFRENVRREMAQLLELPSDCLSIVNLEKSMYNFAIQEGHTRKIVKKWENPAFVFLYADRWKTILMNLDGPLREIIQAEAEKVERMTHQELKPDHWIDMLQQKQKRDAHKFTKHVGASTDMFTCKNCKKKDCTYYEMQTRSADEPATIFITCQTCGKHWRI